MFTYGGYDGDVVTRIHENNIEVRCVTSEGKKLLGELGSLSANSDKDLARFLGKLRECGFVFVAVDKMGWSPADVFEDLRERGLLVGEFTAIAWEGPKKPVLHRR